MEGGGREGQNKGQEYSAPSQSANSTRIKEGDMINVDVTCPAATVALALMFLRTNNHALASRLLLPDSHFLLQAIRPDFVMLRVVARSLILWDSVEPTVEWVQRNIPPIVKKYVDSGRPPCVEEDVEVDLEGIRHVHINIIAGSCMALGLRFAGTCDARAYSVVQNYLRFFLQKQGVSGARNVFPKLEKYLIESSIDAAAIALGMIMGCVLFFFCLLSPPASYLSHGQAARESPAPQSKKNVFVCDGLTLVDVLFWQPGVETLTCCELCECW